MKSDVREADVVIVGGGYSGTMLAAELARRGVSAALVEGGGRVGRGTAFSTPEEAHLLNVPAVQMSAWADRPDDFAKAVEGEGYAPTDFVPRRRFGAYLGAILEEARASGLVLLVEDKAVAAEPEGDGWSVSLADGSRISAKALVLAQGNQPPELPGFARDLPGELFVNNPWSEEGRAAVVRAAEEGGDVLIIGTGLTMVDAVLSLDEAGHRGRIVALSRRGQVPRAHETHEPAPLELGEVPQGSVLALSRWLRRRSAEVGWRAAVDGLRPRSQALWQALGLDEQRRFLRHARPWWDVHRHRIAPEVAARVERMVGEGRLEIIAGRVREIRVEEQGGLRVEMALRPCQRPSTSLRTNGTRRFSLALNCTGPSGAIRKTEDGVLNGLFAAGLARADRLGMGVEIEGSSRVAGAQRAWAVGPLTKGAYWEIVAVPDIREQVAEVAGDIAQELSR